MKKYGKNENVEPAVLIDVQSKCPTCTHEFVHQIRFKRSDLLNMLKHIRETQIEGKAG